MRLCDLSRADLQQFITMKHREGYSSQTVEHLRNVLSRVCGTVSARELLRENLARGLAVPRKQRRRPFGPGASARVLTVRELGALMEGLDGQIRVVITLGT